MKVALRDVALLKAANERRFEKARSITLGVIASQGGSVEVADTPGKVWVSEWGNPESKVAAWKGGNINYIEGTPVQLGRDPKDPFQWQIIGLYEGSLLPGSHHDTTLFTVGPHGQNHQMPSEGNLGTDPVKVWMPAFQPLKTTGSGSSLTITTQPVVYQRDGVRYAWGGQNTDLTSLLPGAGLVRRVLVYLDALTNTLKTIGGTTVVNNGVIPIPYPELPIGGIFSAYVKLANAQTAIVTATHVEDARPPFEGRNLNTAFSATQRGQVLFSVDGVTISPQLPLTTLASGWLVGGDGILMV